MQFVRRISDAVILLFAHDAQKSFELDPGFSQLVRINGLTRKTSDRPDPVHQTNCLVQKEPASFFPEQGQQGNREVHEKIPDLPHLEFVFPEALDLPLNLHGGTTATP